MTDGSILIGGTDRQSPQQFFALEAASGLPLSQPFSEASPADVADACALAAAVGANRSRPLPR